jgi:hypothetical protein
MHEWIDLIRAFLVPIALASRFLPVPAPHSMFPNSKNYPHQTNHQPSDADRNYEDHDVLKQTEVARPVKRKEQNENEPNDHGKH